MTDRLTEIARHLRRKQTDDERKLWSKLRDRRLGGLKFRRQVPCGPYVADFLCEEAALIVELDGSQHAEPTKTVSDAVRTRRLVELGYEVLRFWNVDLQRNFAGVLDTILATANARRSPSSAPSGHLLPTGEGKEPNEMDVK